MDRRINDVLRTLDEHWRKRQRVRDLAKSVNLGSSRLAHLFKLHTNTSIRDAVRRRRIAEAARLLLTTHQRVSEIAYYVGFADMSNFCHTFRREFGVSPRSYRRQALDCPKDND